VAQVDGEVAGHGQVQGDGVVAVAQGDLDVLRHPDGREGLRAVHRGAGQPEYLNPLRGLEDLFPPGYRKSGRLVCPGVSARARRVRQIVGREGWSARVAMGARKWSGWPFAGSFIRLDNRNSWVFPTEENEGDLAARVPDGRADDDHRGSRHSPGRMIGRRPGRRIRPGWVRGRSPNAPRTWA
jgi:hypothetical protein